MATKQQEPNEITTLADLKLDGKNANAGTARGRRMLASSLKRHGAGRSILVDRNGVIIAGNQTAQMAKDVKRIKNIKIVDVTGDTLVAVRRTDLDINDTAARELAISDNRANEENLSWNPEVLANLDIDLYQFWDDKELAKVLGQPLVDPTDKPEVEMKNGFAVIIEDLSEPSQLELIDRLTKEGLICRALTF